MSNKKNKIVLIGMRGSGKSHFGSCLSALLKWPKIDMDDAMEDELGIKIPALIEQKGWDYFRQEEHKMAKKMSKLSHVVISTGGGAITFDRNQKFLTEDAVVVFLFAPLAELVRRLNKDTNERPELEKGVGIEAELRKSWEERKDIYFELSDIVFSPQENLDTNMRINVEKNAKILYEKIKTLI